MDIPTPESYAASLVGVLTPWLITLVRKNWLPWNDKAAMWLSYGIAVVCSTGAYLGIDVSPTLMEWLLSLNGAFATQTIVFRMLKEKLQS